MLAAIHCTHLDYLNRIQEILRMRHRHEDEPQELLQVAALRALTEYEKIYLPDVPDFEAGLLDIVAPPKWQAMMPGRLGIRLKSDTVVQVAIEALGAIGRARAEKALLALVEEIGEGLKPYVVSSIGRIHQRLGGGERPA